MIFLYLLESSLASVCVRMCVIVFGLLWVRSMCVLGLICIIESMDFSFVAIFFQLSTVMIWFQMAMWIVGWVACCFPYFGGILLQYDLLSCI